MNSDDRKRILQLCGDHGCEELTRSRVHVASFSPKHIPLSKDLENAIEAEWEREVAKDRAAGRESLNNKFVRVLSYEEADSDVWLNLGLTDWKHYYGAKKINSPEIIWGIGTASFTYFIDQNTGERVYVFATRDTTKVADIGGRLETPPGGYIEPSLLVNMQNKEQDIFAANLAREFEEELCLPQNRIISAKLIHLIRIPKHHDLSVDFALRISATAEELDNGFEQSRKYGGEHSGHFLVREHELREFINKHIEALPPRTKCDIGSYLLASQMSNDENA